MASDRRPANYFRYTPAQHGAQTRIIQVVEAQKDPMDPTNFQLNKKVPRPPPSPPAPVMHSPPRKITAEEQSKWKIPPCVSNWKNPRGFTTPLDKRCAFDGRNGAQPEVINSNFARLSEALSISGRLHREQIEERNRNERLMAQKEKERNEEILRQRAQQARAERAAMQRGLGHGEDSESEEVEERRKIREERHRERVRNINIKSSAPGTRTKFDRQRERDISEQVALGTARPNTLDNDVHDQRLYNQSQGLGSGFGEDDDYAVYEKPWRSHQSSANTRVSADLLREMAGEDEEEDDKDAPPSKRPFDDDDLEPVQFERETVDKDPLGLEDILGTIRKDPKKAMQQVENVYKRHKS